MRFVPLPHGQTSRRGRSRAVAFATALATVAAAPVLALSAAQPAQALGNGLALTPQLGFNDWNAYGCNVSECNGGSNQQWTLT